MIAIEVKSKSLLSIQEKWTMQQTIEVEHNAQREDYRARVMGCWLGKAVGGTLGMPFEGHDGPLNLEFYTPVPTEMLPNDDLDLQVVWACVLDRLSTVKVDRHILSQAWLDHVDFPWDEYGVAIRNLKNGLKAPLTGSFDNWFVNGMGAPIRSEIWACLAPGNPELAAAYAFEDACVDHGDDGIWGEVFLAALESAAFTESNPGRLIATALHFLPAESRTRRAVEDVQIWWQDCRDWQAVRSRVLEKHGHENFTDAPMNIAFTILGWLASEGDFSRAICIAVNCGKDTDCTGATVGALMGIIDPDCIPDRWLDPIGRSLVLSPGIRDLNAPATLDEFTEMVLDLSQRLDGRLPDAAVYEQSPDGLRISAEIAFAPDMPSTDEPPSLIDAKKLSLPGTVGALECDKFRDEVLLIRYHFHLPAPQRVRVLFNTVSESRIWLDGEYAFGRSGGVMAPSFHRVPSKQSCDADLSAGEHTLIAAVRRPTDRPAAEWVAGIGDAATMQWLPRAFVK